jgi:hypothetical protein
MERKSFFLRFYGLEQGETRMFDCLMELKARMSGLVLVTRKPMTVSVNLFLPPGMNIEVMLHFKTIAARKAAYEDKELRVIYGKYAWPNGNGETTLRKPGDTVFAV